MELVITNDTPLKNINREFQKYFPYLKLEFYRRAHNPEETSDMAESFPGLTLLEEVAGPLSTRIILIDSTDTIADVEQYFQNEFGLAVQVFRKTGSLWVETTCCTLHLTLEEQNKLGQNSCRPRYNINTLFL